MPEQVVASPAIPPPVQSAPRQVGRFPNAAQYSTSTKQIIETRPTSFSPGDPIGVLGNDLKTPLLGHRAEIVELSLRVLIHTGYAQIKGNSFHICSPIEATTSRKKLDSRSS